MKILLFESNKYINKQLEIFLITLGYKVYIATDIENIKDFLYFNKFDLFIFELNENISISINYVDNLREMAGKVPVVFTSKYDIDISLLSSFGYEDLIKLPCEFKIFESKIQAIKIQSDKE